MAERFPATHSTTLRHSKSFPRPSFCFVEPTISQLMYMSTALQPAVYKSIQLNRLACKPDQEFDMFHRREPKRDPKEITRNFYCITILTWLETLSTFEYIKLRGKLIAIDSSHTKKIFRTTLLRVLLRPKRIGYRRDK